MGPTVKCAQMSLHMVWTVIQVSAKVYMNNVDVTSAGYTSYVTI